MASTSFGPPQTRDYFAELYVAGVFGDAGWAVYFPKRDVGFDFIVTKLVGANVLIRPVQVKGKYPVKDGKDGNLGFSGQLSAVHADMVLVLPYFDAHERGVAPSQVAYMPFPSLRPRSRGGYRAVPAKFQGNRVLQRLQFQHFFGEDGLAAVESENWGIVTVADDSDESQDVQ
jgi:hypothetical protein